jgi:lipopolysaccharide assembly outer membrane protein LptD (OstA)
MIQFLTILVLFWGLNPNLSSAQADVEGPAEIHTETNAEKPIQLTADHITQDGTKDIIIAKGNVIVRHKGNVLKADWVKINNKTGRGEAIGHVVLMQRNGTKLKAKRSLFNINSKQGKIFNTRGVIVKNYYVSGKEITRLSDNHYKLKEASLTTCRGTLPDWKIEASTVDLKNNDRALFTHGWFKILDVPVLYLPVGYIPINQERKSGLLLPSIGSSNTDGFTMRNSYYWAINRSHDATLSVEYMEKRGLRPELEYRYAPNKHTRGEIRGSFLDDRLTGEDFWKVDGTHKQNLPKGFKFNGKLDLEGNSGFNKTFSDNTDLRTRRSSDSFASINKAWDNSSLDILTRYRDSTEEDVDDTLFLLPQVTYKTQKTPIGNSLFYFNQDASYTFFKKDLNTSPTIDEDFNVHRIDFHPQISAPMNLAPWLAFTPTIGVRETYYSEGRDTNNQEFSSFSRESFDFQAAFEGPKINKTFHLNSKKYPKLKHLIEPRVIYDYIPAMDGDDRKKIHIIDAVDTVDPTNIVTYFLTQRLLRKETLNGGNFQTNEIMRFEISQSFDFREDSREPIAGQEKRPFSDIRFDVDSRLIDALLFNADATYSVYDDKINTANIELGIKPIDNLSLYVERRYSRDTSTFIMGTVDWALEKGWRLRASTRYDELTKTFRENDVSLLYDTPCQCWGFSFDFINRNTTTNGESRDETKFQLSFTLRGLGSLSAGDNDDLIHREF